MEEDMNGFRIMVAADNDLNLHSKRRFPSQAKRTAIFVLLLPVLLIPGCGKRTPMYAGPPNTVLSVVMKKWAIVPDRIVVPQGAHVELVVSSADVEHGIAVPALGINEPVQPRKPAVVRFLAQTPGIYPMHCSILCGRGHDKMTGVIVITPAPKVAVHK
ncbi:MAG TPA: cupredoxin domain-containing protein [Acidobacteriaceae bacterium]|jgi:cytochrome c oxidase subunit 2|nr:cupredoxin domain-containing protein [Acidobacteriaceae bacterium]